MRLNEGITYKFYLKCLQKVFRKFLFWCLGWFSWKSLEVLIYKFWHKLHFCTLIDPHILGAKNKKRTPFLEHIPNNLFFFFFFFSFNEIVHQIISFSGVPMCDVTFIFECPFPPPPPTRRERVFSKLKDCMGLLFTQASYVPWVYSMPSVWF